MTALCNRAGHYIFALWFVMAALCNRGGHYVLSFGFYLLSTYLSMFFPRLISAAGGGCLSYFHTWCGLRANLECMSEMCSTRLAANTGRKNDAKIAILAPSHNFVGLYLRS